MDYSKRLITDVQITGLQQHEGYDGTTVSGSVRLQLSAHDGNEFGPTATIELATDLTGNATFQDVERQLLVAALGVLGRLAALSPKDAHAELQKSRFRQYLSKTP
ncbi:hypothetical protein [Phyllobacterium leguminum]|uniref:Uncharacterized protein n=1 Tax=Phyllobacterium leguminum TaxID=314237 RepID=A0A318TGK7_9HYPH|nr:hypothetical protein [Phyllobacterium leguminum]PYE87822.1 hypothetical protein C7477_1105 [Phyllobacterium leguminum]